MIQRLNHVAIAVPDLAQASTLYREVLGADVSEPTPVPEQGVTVAFVSLSNTKVELLHPLGNDSPIASFLDRTRSGGIHHLSFGVEDIEAAVKTTEDAGLRVLGPAKTGAHGKPVVFLHPTDFLGTLIELEKV